MRLRSSHPAVNIIQHDHDVLSAVLQGMLQIIRAIGESGKAPDLKVLRAMLFYIHEYPERVHHPKEDRFLFPMIRKRTREADDAMIELEAQHALGDRLVLDLEHALNRFELEGAAAFDAFALMAEQYADFYKAHMRLEEQTILAVALKVLSEDDWRELDAAFAEEKNPLAGSRHEAGMQQLFSLIVNIAPPPVGVGPAM
ncbi:hemerythrin domain-containing protein [Noviherbaspirillum aerium]|uniref:hemerythrin domain-containing protein n=1 Tax=Noviherbaspirillum aerium TaxID=2588497 RepID=UPI00124F3BBC|nr:hemerythrin domain-containing protein [Noviherbaspirillum aerium]